MVVRAIVHLSWLTELQLALRPPNTGIVGTVSIRRVAAVIRRTVLVFVRTTGATTRSLKRRIVGDLRRRMVIQRAGVARRTIESRRPIVASYVVRVVKSLYKMTGTLISIIRIRRRRIVYCERVSAVFVRCHGRLRYLDRMG